MILLLGATGYVGQAFSLELRQRGISFIPLTRKAVDYSNFDVLFSYVRKMKPEFVINAAGYAPNPNLEARESAHWEVLCANALLPQTIARACLMTNTPWAHISSGNIYTGAKVEMTNGQMQIERDLNRPEIRQFFATHPERFHGFTEWDEPNLSFRRAPCNFYCGSKALAEEAIHGMGRCYIWRPAAIFDERDDGRNLLSKLQRCRSVYDGIITVSQLNDFVRACLELWENGAAFGIYNVVNTGAVTIERVVELTRQILKPVPEIELLDHDGMGSSEVPSATSCSSCILDTAKLLATKVKMRATEDALRSSLRKWRDGATLSAYVAANPNPVSAFSDLDPMALFEKLFVRQT
ncbi:MAG TPA: sugar nucleotide-binding protein [Verrucomicrobiae bacterium]|jgi:dTDP-4-dehydrorhamnose reductase|nr:sugar nucleotide-binding protein [Verrucomicrobiae bacterium]